MQELLTKLSKCLDQDLDMNLVVTGLFAKLCYYPVLALTLYLMSYQPNVAPSVPTLYGCIEKVIFILFYFLILLLFVFVLLYILMIGRDS